MRSRKSTKKQNRPNELESAHKCQSMLEVLELIECVCSAESVSVDVYVPRCVSVKPTWAHTSVMLLSILKEARGSQGRVSSLVATQMSERKFDRGTVRTRCDGKERTQTRMCGWAQRRDTEAQ